MSVVIEKTDSTLGATVTGVDLSNLDDTDWRAVYDAFPFRPAVHGHLRPT